MAQAFAIIHGKNVVRAFSAGIKSATDIRPLAIEVMKEVGYNLMIHETQSLPQFLFKEYEYVITVGCPNACLFVSAKCREDWVLENTPKMSLAELRWVRNTIELKVQDLLKQIEADRNNFLSIG